MPNVNFIILQVVVYNEKLCLHLDIPVDLAKNRSQIVVIFTEKSPKWYLLITMAICTHYLLKKGMSMQR